MNPCSVILIAVAGSDFKIFVNYCGNGIGDLCFSRITGIVDPRPKRRLE